MLPFEFVVIGKPISQQTKDRKRLQAWKKKVRRAAEVRTKENLTLNDSEDLCQISESVQNLPGWEFELVVTNTRKKPD